MNSAFCGFAYRRLLQMYPAGFRQRFAAEMLELAEAAEPSEVALDFWRYNRCDCAQLARTWHNPFSGCHDRAGGNIYTVGDSPVKPWRLFQGLALATALALGACYISTLTVWPLPSYPDDAVCGKASAKMTRR